MYRSLRLPQYRRWRPRHQLKISAPAHPWVAKYGELETSFDRCANQLSKE